MLARVEKDPDGWRLCALALMEAQALRNSVGALSRELVADKATPRITTALKPARRHLVSWTARAAVFLIAFAAGAFSATLLAVDRSHRGDRSGGLPQIVREASAERADARGGARGGFVHRVSRVSLSEPAMGPPPKADDEPANLDSSLLSSQDAYMPEYAQAYYQNQGFEVRRDRRVVSLVLDDGSTAVLPLEQLSLQYVGQQIH